MKRTIANAESILTELTEWSFKRGLRLSTDWEALDIIIIHARQWLGHNVRTHEEVQKAKEIQDGSARD